MMIDEKKLIEELRKSNLHHASNSREEVLLDRTIRIVKEQPKVGEWIPVEERLPNDLQEVSVTFVNHKPHSYYEKIKDIPMSAFAVYFRGIWYWWTSTICDYIAEYGGCASQMIDESIEVIAWRPRPEPYRKDNVDD